MGGWVGGWFTFGRRWRTERRPSVGKMAAAETVGGWVVWWDGKEEVGEEGLDCFWVG